MINPIKKSYDVNIRYCLSKINIKGNKGENIISDLQGLVFIYLNTLSNIWKEYSECMEIWRQGISIVKT